VAAEEAVLRSADATAAQYGADSTAAAMCDLRLGTIRMGALCAVLALLNSRTHRQWHQPAAWRPCTRLS